MNCEEKNSAVFAKGVFFLLFFLEKLRNIFLPFTPAPSLSSLRMLAAKIAELYSVHA